MPAIDNLTRAGGDRYADKKKVLGVIALALADGFSDIEVRRFFGLKAGDVVSLNRRKRMGNAKAPAFYKAMIEAFKAGALEDLTKGRRVLVDGVWVDRPNKGLNVGGVLRLGKVPCSGFRLTACDGVGVSLASRGIEIERVPADPTGLYIYFMMNPVDFAAYGAAFMAAGWRHPVAPGLDGPESVGLLYGPLPGAVLNQSYPVPWPTAAGGASSAVVDTQIKSSEADDFGGPYCWAYVDADGVTKRVKWQGQDTGGGGFRLVVEVLDTFWCELNGVVP